MRLRERLSADASHVLNLLAEAGLPGEGLERTQGWVIEKAGELIGHVAVEATPDALVLRSLVVAPGHRGQGLGQRLVAVAEGAAQGRLLVLKTSTIGPWALRRGYRLATLDQVPESVRATTQFSGSLCAGTPVFIKEDTMNQEALKAEVRQRYAETVKRNQSCCGPKSCGCSGGLQDPSLKVGYSLQDVQAVPEGSNLGLGCGNPVALASLKPGEIVLDLGSGAGFDAFLAAQRVGAEGRVIGVDMTPEMLERARSLARKGGYANVEFREGDIESLPVEEGRVDAVISNCVINLTPDKAQAFREAYRVLKPGGRLMVSDIVLLKPLPESIRQDMDAYAACISGALLKEDYLAAISKAGFQSIEIVGESAYDFEDPALASADFKSAAGSVVSVQVRAIKATEGSHD